MARVALAIGGAIAGGVVGFFLGGPMGAVQGAILGASIGAQIIGPHITGPEGPRLGDLQVSTSTNGAPIPFGYGAMRLAANIIWSPGLLEHSTTTEESTKGGGTVSTTSYSYTASFAAAFGEGPGTIKRVWGDTKVIYDPQQGGDTPAEWEYLTGYSYGDIVKYGGQYWFAQNPVVGIPPDTYPIYAWAPYNWTPEPSKYPEPTLYPGSQTQNPDPTIQAERGADNTPAFRGLIYAVWEDFPLGDFGNRIPNLRAEVEFKNPDGSSVTTLAEIVRDLSLRAGLEAAEIDTGELPS